MTVSSNYLLKRTMWSIMVAYLGLSVLAPLAMFFSWFVAAVLGAIWLLATPLASIIFYSQNKLYGLHGLAALIGVMVLGYAISSIAHAFSASVGYIFLPIGGLLFFILNASALHRIWEEAPKPTVQKLGCGAEHS